MIMQPGCTAWMHCGTKWNHKPESSCLHATRFPLCFKWDKPRCRPRARLRLAQGRPLPQAPTRGMHGKREKPEAAPGLDNHPDHTMKVWTALTGSMVTHPSPNLTRPPWTAKLTTEGLPYQGLQIPLKSGLGLVPPCMQDGGGLELGESFALPCRGIVWELSHWCRCWTEPGPSHRGLEGPQKPTEAVFMV